MMPEREELVKDIARMMVPIQTTAQCFSQTLIFIPAIPPFQISYFMKMRRKILSWGFGGPRLKDDFWSAFSFRI
jgi:hypothetical protein